MADYYVLQTLKVAGRIRYVLRGLVEDVPNGTTAKAVTEALDAAGQAPSDAGIAWANHTVKAAERAPEVQNGPDPWAWNWENLLIAGSRPALRQLNVRIPVTLYRQCEGAALAAGVNLRAWVESALTVALEAEAEPAAEQDN